MGLLMITFNRRVQVGCISPLKYFMISVYGRGRVFLFRKSRHHQKTLAATARRDINVVRVSSRADIKVGRYLVDK